SAGSALHGQPAAGCLENRPRARSVEAAAARPAAPPLSLFRGRKDRIPTRLSGLGFWFWVLDDALLSHGEAPHYHRRGVVSLLSSGWDQVVPTLYGRQAIRLGHRGLGATPKRACDVCRLCGSLQIFGSGRLHHHPICLADCLGVIWSSLTGN